MFSLCRIRHSVAAPLFEYILTLDSILFRLEEKQKSLPFTKSKKKSKMSGIWCYVTI